MYHNNNIIQYYLFLRMRELQYGYWYSPDIYFSTHYIKSCVMPAFAPVGYVPQERWHHWEMADSD